MSESFPKPVSAEGVSSRPDTLKNEHLSPGIRPIMAGIFNARNLGDSRELTKKIMNEGTFVDYYGDQEKLTENNIVSAGENTYVISDCTPSDKWSNEYHNCTGVVIVGKDKETAKEISILSHQDPWRFLKGTEHSAKFREDMLRQIEKITSQCEKGTVDAVIFGGQYVRDSYEYAESISTISDICNEGLVCTSGPYGSFRAYRGKSTCNCYFF
jgi:hypothetical protein